MAKVTFGSLKLKKTEEVNKISIADKEIEVKTYLPIEDKYDLIQATLLEASEVIVFNEVLLELNLNLNIIYLYTNLTFTDLQRQDKFKLYDILETNNIINDVIEAIPEKEFKILINLFNKELNRMIEENRSAAGIVNNLIGDFPKKAQEVANILGQIDFSQMNDIINFADALGINIPEQVETTPTLVPVE